MRNATPPHLDHIGRLLFELALLANAHDTLEQHFSKLLTLLAEYPVLGLKQQGAILLLNPQGEPIQIAQYGLPPAWSSECIWHCLGEHNRPDRSCPVLFLDQGCPNGGSQQPCRDTPTCLLRLAHENKVLGYAVFFVADPALAAETLPPIINDLARAITGLVQRVMMDEIITIREWELEEARTEVIRRLGSAAEHRDKETGWHVVRMSNYALALARALELSEEEREVLLLAAPMHDVGKIGIPDDILRKPGPLTDEERAVMCRHTEIGETLLKGSDRLITAAREIAGCHHEHWDGQGYPRGLRGEEIPILARICAVADVFDALTSRRPYKQSWTVEEAAAWIEDQSGTQFDPSMVAAFRRALPDMLRIRELYRDDIIDPRQVLSLPQAMGEPDGWVTWDASLSVGIAVIDEHHKHLFDLVNDLFQVVAKQRGAKEVARVLKALDLYARIHFTAEERMMEQYQHSGLKHQHRQHRLFGEKLQAFYAQLHVNPLTTQYDVLEFTRHWLVTHILEEDSQLAELAETVPVPA